VSWAVRKLYETPPTLNEPSESATVVWPVVRFDTSAVTVPAPLGGLPSSVTLAYTW
jgi:hypothetical protein